jgi:hypothetical protein
MERRAAMERSDSSLTRHNADEEGHGMAGHATRPSRPRRERPQVVTRPVQTRTKPRPRGPSEFYVIQIEDWDWSFSLPR